MPAPAKPPRKTGKTEYRQRVAALRTELLDIQARLGATKKLAVALLISGQDGAGKSETINTLYGWMDPHGLDTLAFAEPSDEESERPALWRYWVHLPARGRIGIFAGSWYSIPIRDHLLRRLSTAELDLRAADINRFEAMLHHEGVLVLKFWFHLNKAAQKKRLQALARDARTAWRVTPGSWERLKDVPRLHRTAAHLLRITDTPHAPWHVIDAEQDEHPELTVGRVLLQTLQQRLQETAQPSPAEPAPVPASPAGSRAILDALRLDQRLDEASYQLELPYWQGRLAELARHPRLRKRAVVAVLEGPDAAGKGGAIRRIIAALDARQYKVVPISAPSDEELLQPYLWRFWRHLPRHGRFVFFDRSWYGRVLVERVERLCGLADWMRAYDEINDFESQLAASGIIVVKFWLQISPDEQLRRFRQREAVAFKRYKLTPEDWRNRDKWDAYQQAACDMIARTSTGAAPWTLVESNDKPYARVKILRTLCEILQRELKAARKPTDRKAGG